MNRFIAYFDFLGFKGFINKNTLQEQEIVIRNIWIDIESALSNERRKDSIHEGEYLADTSLSNINCIHFSDTVIFYTKDISDDSFNELIKATYFFNQRAIIYRFPIRGAIVYGELVVENYIQRNNYGTVYHGLSIYGKGYLRAHQIANDQNWAGTVIDESVISEIRNRDHEPENYLSPYAKKYKVPKKCGASDLEEYALKLFKNPLNEIKIKNCSDKIKQNFALHKKSVEDLFVKQKINNTITFLESHPKSTE